MRLYKKDKVNLSKVLKNLLIIAKKFDILKNLNIPELMIKSLLNS